MKLPAWHEVMKPRDEICAGNFLQSEFAADLAAVSKSESSEEYREPVKFFHRTYLTDGLKNLLGQALNRVVGRGGDPIIQLKTSFGGGKTHSLLAIYHLFNGRAALANEKSIQEFLSERGIEKIPEDVKIATLVGTANSESRIWESIARQLTNDSNLLDLIRGEIAPGSDNWKQFLDSCGACVILIDEFVAYARNRTSDFEQTLTFIQSITEGIRRSDRSVFVVSVPESEIEIGSEKGHQAAKMIEHIFQRINVVWRPVTPEESFAIVRQRLFRSSIDEDKKDQICDEFFDMYCNNPNEFPTSSKQADYRNRLKDCYPIHPEIFQTLFGRWATAFPNFQRTRGVLRLMAGVIYELYKSKDPNCIIMLGSFPLSKSQVSEDLLHYLEKPWDTIIANEIEKSGAREIDSPDSRFGKINAATRIARALLLNTAPTSRDQTVRGMTVEEIHLSTILPNEIADISVFNDALGQLKSNLIYLYSNDTRYWFDTRATIQKRVRELESRIDPAEILNEISKRSRDLLIRSIKTPRVIYPKVPKDVATRDDVQLIILPPDQYHSPGNMNSFATNKSKFFFPHMQKKNLFLFIATSEDELNKMKSIVRTYLAWQEAIDEDRRGELNLDSRQKKDAHESMEKINKEIKSEIPKLYRFILSPREDTSTHEISWSDTEIEFTSNGLEFELQKSLDKNGWLFTKITPKRLRMKLEEIWTERSISIDQIWNACENFTYMPRLLNRGVLDTSIQIGCNDQKFFVENGILSLEPPKTSEPEVEEVETVEEKFPDQIEESESRTQPVVEKKKKNFNFKTSCRPKDLKSYISKIDSNIIQNLPDGVTGIVTIELDVHFANGFSDDDQSILSDESKKLDINFKLN